jgi:hypothetical protein
VRCGKAATKGNRCDEHAVDLERSRGTRQQRGYDAEHERIRKRLMSEFGRAYRNREAPKCWRCGERMHPWQRLHADHSKIAARDGGQADCLTHGWCNEGKVLPAAP